MLIRGKRPTYNDETKQPEHISIENPYTRLECNSLSQQSDDEMAKFWILIAVVNFCSYFSQSRQVLRQKNEGKSNGFLGKNHDQVLLRIIL